MAINGNDSFGSFVDTGVGSAPTPRTNTHIEIHAGTDVSADTGAKFVNTAALHGSHISYRGNSPR